MSNSEKVLVWDWSLRVFHWALVILVAALWWTAEQGLMSWHRQLGLAMVALLVFRMALGVFGPKTARLDKLVVSPTRIISYLRAMLTRQHAPSFGHTPLGGFSVLAMLLALIVQTGSGLFAIDVDGLDSGPLASLVSFDTGRSVADFHETSFNVLLGLIILHLVAIAVYVLILKDNILKPMITGHRPRGTFSEQLASAQVRLWIVALAALSGFFSIAAINWIG